LLSVVFFFQAEDGIRDRNVTGVQTCALPISIGKFQGVIISTPAELNNKFAMSVRSPIGVVGIITPWNFPIAIATWKSFPAIVAEIGRASCRERVRVWVVEGAVKNKDDRVKRK